MAIETARVLQEIEKHLTQAKTAQPGTVREPIAAIRALCDLVLDDAQQPEAPPRAVRLSSPEPVQVTSLNKLEEDDANGDSLFEF